MTETPQQERAEHGLDTAHLRDYSRLRRSTTDRKFAGVAGGLGRHLNIDPTILRVAFVVLCFFGGAGFLLYGALWLFVPEDGKDQAAVATSSSTRNAILAVAAVLAALLIVGDSWGGVGFPWPLAVLALVAFLILMNRDSSMTTQNTQYPQYQAGPPAGPGAVPPPPPGATTTDPTNPAAYGTEPTMRYDSPVPPWTAPVQQAYVPPAPKPDRGPSLLWVTLALGAVALGSLGLYDVAQGGVPDAAYPALALALIGAMLVVGAWVGRAGSLVLLGIIAAMALAGTSVTEPRFAGDRVIDASPTTAAQVDDRYFVPAGSIHVDLSNIRDVEALDGRTIDVEANAGELVVTLPPGLDAAVTADIAVAGEAQIRDETRNGTDVFFQRDLDGGADAPEIELNLDLVVGSIEVRQ